MTFKNKLGPAAVGLVALMFAGGTALAQQTPPTQEEQQETQQQEQQEHQNKMSHVTDQEFAKMVAQGNIAEQKTSELAEQKSQNQDVKQLANRLAQDHSKAQDKLQNAASQDNVNLPTEPNQMQKNMYDRLSNLSGEQFDKAYTRDEVKGHEKMIRLFKHEAMNGKDQNLKSYAQETLPTLEEHLKLARQAYKSVEGNGTSTPGTGH